MAWQAVLAWRLKTLETGPVCMCVCVCVYVYVCERAHTLAHTDTCVCVYVYVCVRDKQKEKHNVVSITVILL